MRPGALPALVLAAFFAAVVPASAAPVLMISIDGLRPADVIDAPARGLKVPNLRALMADGAWASGRAQHAADRDLSRPHHAGDRRLARRARRHAPTPCSTRCRRTCRAGTGYARDVKVEGLWEDVHKAGFKTASVNWPVTVGHDFIDYNVPEFWRIFYPPEDAKLLEAVSTRGLLDELSRVGGTPEEALIGEEPENDQARANIAVALLSLKHPKFMTLHLTALDHNEHKYGPGSKEANAVLEKLDAQIGEVVAAARRAAPTPSWRSSPTTASHPWSTM